MKSNMWQDRFFYIYNLSHLSQEHIQTHIHSDTYVDYIINIVVL